MPFDSIDERKTLSDEAGLSDLPHRPDVAPAENPNDACCVYRAHAASCLYVTTTGCPGHRSPLTKWLLPVNAANLSLRPQTGHQRSVSLSGGLVTPHPLTKQRQLR